jgi:DNA-directed RNA polymerase specialized sigma24 family protein
MPDSTPPPEVLALSPSQLRQRCAAVQRGMAVHEPFCYELFRRAIVQKDQRCWEEIFDHYQSFVRSWLKKMVPSGRVHEIEEQEMITIIFGKFWRSYDRTRFSRAQHVGQILSYLQSCVVSCVNDERRKQKRKGLKTVEWNDQTPDSDALEHLEDVLKVIYCQQVWQKLEELCQTEQERVILRLSVVDDCKPKEIAELRPELFVDADDVYPIKRKLMERLRANEDLHRFLSLYSKG